MVKKPGRSKKARALRKRAETHLKVTRRDIEAMSVKDVQQLVHELQVHQIELEMQNEELRRTQAELEATCDRYQLMLYGKGMILDANLPACTLLGINPKNLMDQPIVRFLAEKSQAAVLCHLRKLLNTGMQQACEVDLARQADVPVSVRFESIVVRDKRGQPAHVLSTLQDITERKQAEAVLKLAQFSIDQTADSVFWVDPDARIVYVNETACRAPGYSKNELLSMTLYDVDPNFPASARPTHWKDLRRRKMFTFESSQRTKTGGLIRTEVNANHIELDGQELNCLFVLDTAERKRAEEELRSREFGLKEAQRLARVGSWELDLQTSNLTWSDETYRIFEIDPAAFQASYEGFLNLVHPDDREMVNRAYSDSVANEAPYDITHRLLMKDGRIKFVQERCQTDYLPDGTPSRSIGTIQDITERKQIEDALQFLSTGLIHLHDEAFFSKMADHAAKLLGLEIGFVGKLLPTKPPRIRAIGLSIDGQALSPVEYDLAKTPCERVISKQTAIFPEQVQQLFPDDRMLVELGVSSYAAIPLCDRNGCVIGHVGVMSRRPLRQVKLVENLLQLFAVRAAAELERQRTETMFHDLFEFSSEAIVMVNQAGLITLANRQAESLFGYSQAEFLDLPVETLMPESGRQGHVHMRQRFFSSATPRMMGLGASELCAMKKDGTIFPVDISLSPIQSEDGLLVAASVIDITKRKQLDDQLALHAEELERLVIDRTAKIAKLEAQRAQTEKLVALGRLAAGIAHEINNPIAGIKNAFLIVKDAIPPDFAYYDFVGMIDREIDRVAGIIGLMYQLHSSEPPRKQVLDVAVLIHDLTALVAPQLNQHQLSIIIEPSPALPQLMVSQRDLLQVLLNLVRNAIDASLEFGEINVSFKINSTHVFISVKDQGSGIDPHVLPRIFEPFFSTKNTGVDKNMGLGLSVSHSLVCAMGGSIDVQSQVGAGSTVRIVLPIPADCVTSNGAMSYL